MREYHAEFIISYDSHGELYEFEHENEVFTDFDEAQKYIQRNIVAWFNERMADIYGEFIIKKINAEDDSVQTEWRYGYDGQLIGREENG